jgi:FkbM family methyltransferase
MLIKALVSTFCLGTAFLIMMSFRTPRRLIGYALGRTSSCTLGEVLSAPDERARYRRAEMMVRRAGKALRVDDGLEFWPTEQGPYWILPGNAKMLYSMLLEEEEHIYSNQGADVKAGDIVLDCGANIGTFSCIALRKGASLVVAIEPVPENLKCLRRNLDSAVVTGRTIIYPKGVWDKDDWLTITTEPDNSPADSFVLRRSGRQIRLPLTTIDHIVTELHLPRVDFIKMDIEGSERNALAGAKETLARFRPRMAICVYHLPDDPVAIPGVVAAANPSYHTDRPSCVELRDGTVRRHIQYFH